MATGNPRNKVALKPGFSLVGWIRLTNSGEDLTGFKGKRFSVSQQELAKHNKINDCWIAVRGKVYNITRYLDYHPGGVDELMRGAGIDATSLFDEYHAWVNIEQLLAKCFIGPLKNVVTLDLNTISESSTKTKNNSLTTLSPPITLPPLKKDVQAALFQIPTQQTPRFDWIQKKNDLTIYFYTKNFSNPGICAKEQSCDKEFEVTLYIEQTAYSYKFLFFKSVKHSPGIKINQETGKIEIIFEKEESEVWPSFGSYEILPSKDDDEFTECIIVEKDFINHDTFMLTIRPKINTIIVASVGYHYDFKLNIFGKDIIRSFTPVPQKYIPSANSNNLLNLNFLIKKYNNGAMSKYLSERNIDENIYISSQRGSFNLSKLRNHSRILILAAGSGITPFLSITEHLIRRTTNKVDNIYLYYFNKTEQDIWCRKLLDEIMETDQRFVFKNVLSEADKNWKGERGRVSEKILDEISKRNFTYALVCGPIAFNTEAARILTLHTCIETECFQG